MSFSVIVPSRNATNLVACIRAIREAGETCRIIVVWDGDWPLKNDSDTVIHVMPGEKPFVFARNVNIGIRAAGDDDVVICNDDALLKTPRGFSALESRVKLFDRCGLIASTCNNVGNVNQHNMAEKYGKSSLRADDRMVCFVCVYIPRTTINAVGMLDERFVDYGMDDDDYSLRVRNAGLKLGIFDGCFVDHGSLTSSYRGAAGRGGDFHPNLKRFIEKWGVDNRGLGRDKSPFKALFPWPRCEDSFHGARCTLKRGHDDDHNYYPGSLPEAA